MRAFGILGAVAAIVLAFAGNSVCAQTATTAAVGKPMALLAGLRPPHETRHKVAKHTIHAKAAHEKTGGKMRHARMAAAHARHASARTSAARHRAHHERAVAASAFAEESPPQADPNPPHAAVANWRAENVAPANDSAPSMAASPVAPVSTNAAATAGSDAQPDPSKVQTIKIAAPDPVSRSDPTAEQATSVTAKDGAVVAPSGAAQTVLAAPVHGSTSKAVGSTSWIAQMLAALGGAVAAGVVAWFLIGSGPVRTYG